MYKKLYLCILSFLSEVENNVLNLRSENVRVFGRIIYNIVSMFQN